MRTILALLTSLVALMTSNIASGVTLGRGQGEPHGENQCVTTMPASRAQTEVQVRRLHGLLVTKHGDDETVDQYRRLQKRLQTIK